MGKKPSNITLVSLSLHLVLHRQQKHVTKWRQNGGIFQMK